MGRTLSPVKRRRKILHEPFYSSPESSLETPVFLPTGPVPSPHRLPPQASPSSMKRTMNTPSRSHWNSRGPVVDKVPVGGSISICAHPLTSGLPLESQWECPDKGYLPPGLSEACVVEWAGRPTFPSRMAFKDGGSGSESTVSFFSVGEQQGCFLSSVTQPERDWVSRYNSGGHRPRNIQRMHRGPKKFKLNV